jgi:hypothetical protein
MLRSFFLSSEQDFEQNAELLLAGENTVPQRQHSRPARLVERALHS